MIFIISIKEMICTGSTNQSFMLQVSQTLGICMKIKSQL